MIVLICIRPSRSEWTKGEKVSKLGGRVVLLMDCQAGLRSGFRCNLGCKFELYIYEGNAP